MSQRTFTFAGVVLILTGLAALTFTMTIPMLGLNLWFLGPWRLWPVLVLGLGLLFVLPPILRRRRPGLGLLFIPGMPILTTGAILLLASLFNWWSVWEWLWPQLVLALALGFAFAAIYGHRVWLAAPAIIKPRSRRCPRPPGFRQTRWSCSTVSASWATCPTMAATRCPNRPCESASAGRESCSRVSGRG